MVAINWARSAEVNSSAATVTGVVAMCKTGSPTMRMGTFAWWASLSAPTIRGQARRRAIGLGAPRGGEASSPKTQTARRLAGMSQDSHSGMSRRAADQSNKVGRLAGGLPPDGSWRGSIFAEEAPT